MANQFPEKFGKYRIIAEVGRGGFADVYKAIDTTLDRTVALKFLEPRLLREPTFVERFQREARLAANLKHPHIVFVHEFGWEAGTVYIAMEFLEGRTLKEVILEEGALPPARIVNIVRQVASALDYAHGRGLVHRDVKPANVMVGGDDHATVMDFGIAKAATQTALTTTGRIFGTPEYMSPEQAEGEEEPDARSDVYSLGVVAYEMFTGQVPFSGTTPLSILRGHTDKQPPRPSQINPAVSPAVEAVLLKVLAKKRDERYQHAGEMARALAAAVETKAEKKAEREGKPPVQGGLPTWGWGAIALVAALAIGGAIFLAIQGGKPTTTPVPVARAATPTATVTATATPMPPTDTPAPSPTPLPPTGTPTFTSTPTKTPTLVPPTATPVVPTPTPLPPTNTPTPLLPTDTPTPSVPPDMVYVPAGEFAMGSSDSEVDYALQLCKAHPSYYWHSGYWKFKDEQPMHTVYLDAFYIDRTEVTNTQYRQCVEAGACSPPHHAEGWLGSPFGGYTDYDEYNDPNRTEHPVVDVDWNQVSIYCQWAGKRLPTEAEWEKAARGTDGWMYPWGNTFDGSKVNFCDKNCPDMSSDASMDDGYTDTAPIGSYLAGASPYGALDMAGNVWEWVADWYDEGYYSRSPARNPQGPDSGEYKVLRGGSWNGPQRYTRCASRLWIAPGHSANDVGFRCARGSQ